MTTENARVQTITGSREGQASDGVVVHIYAALMEDGTGRDIIRAETGEWLSDEGNVNVASVHRARTLWRLKNASPVVLGSLHDDDDEVDKALAALDEGRG